MFKPRDHVWRLALVVRRLLTMVVFCSDVHDNMIGTIPASIGQIWGLKYLYATPTPSPFPTDQPCNKPVNYTATRAATTNPTTLSDVIAMLQVHGYQPVVWCCTGQCWDACCFGDAVCGERAFHVERIDARGAATSVQTT